MSLLARSLLVLTILFGLVLVIAVLVSEVFGLPNYAVLLFGLAFLAIQFLVAPILIDWILTLLYRFDWVAPEIVDPQMAEFLDDLCRAYKIPRPRFGVIFPWNARLVITQGILDMLDEDERKAVIAHEVGHIVHWDFAVMTIAMVVPIVLYIFARFSLEMVHRSRRGRLPAIVAAVVAYIAYVLSQYLVLFLSRIREYYADEFSAIVTRNPNALATALAKVAYGLAQVANDEEVKGVPTKIETVRALGIFDPAMARGLVAAALGVSANTHVSPVSVVKAMQWDLWNPWAWVCELSSTHPLPARRLKALEQLAVKFNQTPVFDFPEKPSESYWDEFLTDLVITSLPYLGVVIGLAGVIIILLNFVQGNLLTWLGAAFLVGGSGYLIKVFHLNPMGEFPLRKIEELVSEVKVVGIRSIPCALKGKLIGRGEPGFILSADMVLQDETGFIVLLYRQPLSIFEWLFGLFYLEQLIGLTITAIGWYRRSPVPYVELLKVVTEHGVEFNCYFYQTRLILGAIAIAVGIGFLVFALV